MTPQNKDNALNRASDAINNAIKKIGKDRLKAIVDEVKAMHISGPTFEEYFENFESQYPLFDETFNKQEEVTAINSAIAEWITSPVDGYSIYAEPLSGISAGTVQTGGLLSGFHAFDKINIASAEIVNGIMFPGMEWSQMIEPSPSYKFGWQGVVSSFFENRIKPEPPPNCVGVLCSPPVDDDDNFDHWPSPSGFLF